jgi:hypothetical protein
VARGETLPQTIGTLQLVRLQSGKEAREEINRLHGKQLSFLKGYIGTYKYGEKKATIWLSVYESDDTAERELVKMAESLKVGKSGVFRHFQTLSIKEESVYFVTGMGQAHYFFDKGKKVFWLAVEPSEARQVIRDLVEKIP